MGSGILFRADKLYHSAELVNTQKRAITLFINIKLVDNSQEISIEEPIIRSVNMPEQMQKDALTLIK